MDKRIEIYNKLLFDEITGQSFRLWNGMKIYDDEWCFIDRFIKKRDKINYLYLTLSPDKYKRNLKQEQAHDLKLWCSKWFTEKNSFYHGGVYVVENGSDGDHLHVHCLLNIKNSLKHAFKLKNYWKTNFPGSPLLTSLNLCAQGNSNSRGEYCYAVITDRKILSDKVSYFTDSEKGFHENHSIIMEPCFFGDPIKI